MVGRIGSGIARVSRLNRRSRLRWADWESETFFDAIPRFNGWCEPRIDSFPLRGSGMRGSCAGEVNASLNRGGKLGRSLTKKRDPLCFFVKYPHVGGDTGKPCVTGALSVPRAIVLAGAPFPPTLSCRAVGRPLLTITARRPPMPYHSNHACTTPGRPVWLNPLIRQTSQLVIQGRPHSIESQSKLFHLHAIELATSPRV